MRRSVIAAVMLALTLAAPARAFAVLDEVVKLRTGASYKEYLRVSDDFLLWQDFRHTDFWSFRNLDIYGYDLSAGREIAVATASGIQRWPAVSGHVFVWGEQGLTGEDIYGCAPDATTTPFAICTARGNQRVPEISGSRVVWEDYRADSSLQLNQGDIYMFDLDTKTESAVCTDAGTQMQPAIWGDYVVWTDMGGSSWDAAIRGKNLRTGERFTVCAFGGRQDYPRIGDGIVVWQDNRKEYDSDVWGFDLKTRKQFPIATSKLSESSCQIGSNIVGWISKDWATGMTSVVGYDMLSGSTWSIRPSRTEYTAYFGGLANGRVAWLQGDANTRTDLYLSRVTEMSEIDGDSRYGTAVQASREAFPEGAETVILATGESWPDALGGAALAGAEDGAMLLTPRGSLPAAVAGEIERLQATRVLILGGPSSVSTLVADQVAARVGAENVTRISGANRYTTACEVASRTVSAQDGAFDGTALVAAGFADAMSASPLAALKGWPVYLCGPAGVGQETIDAMKTAGVKRVILLGSTAVIGPGEERRLAWLFGGAGNITRLGGPNRYATAAAVAEYAVSKGFLRWNRVAITTGQNFPDGLTAGVLQARRKAPLLLTPKWYLAGETAAVLKLHDGLIADLTYLGNTSAVSRPARKGVRDVLH